MSKNYIIGYGSLINFESQNITGKSFSSIPIIVKNYTRSWSVTYKELQFCALGIYPEKNKNLNAVLFEVENLDVYDQREHGYTRYDFDRKSIEPWNLDDNIPSDGKIWIYLPDQKKIGKPSGEFFIWQSYVDVVLMGCLSISKNFAEEFIKTTSAWDKNFFSNDREKSAYIRALKKYDSHQIDQLIALIK